MFTAAQILRRVSSPKRGCGPCPLPKGTGGATAPTRATKAKLVILETRIFAMTPIGTSQSSALAGTLTPETLFLSGFDPETVHPENVRTAGVCGFSGVVDDAACLSCFFFRPSYSLKTRNQLLQRKLPFANFAYKCRTPRFRCWMGNDATPLRKIAHSGSRGDNFLKCPHFFFTASYSLICGANFD